MGLQAIFDPMVRAYFKKLYGGSGGSAYADELTVALATKGSYALKSDAVMEVAEYAFYNNTYLTSVDFPSAQAIGMGAFSKCSNLAEVNFQNAQTMGTSAFGSCSNLAEANFQNAQTIGNSAFSSCSNLAEANFQNAQTIGNSAFRDCTTLTKLDFPVLKSVANGAFASCSSLTALIIRTTSTVCAVANLDAFTGTPMLTGEGHVYVPTSMYEAYRSAYEPNLEAGFFDILFRKIEDYPDICA